MTRRQRRLAYGVCVGVVWAICAVILLGRSSVGRRTTTGTFGTRTERYGLMRYLMIVEGPETFAGVAGPGHSTRWEWQGRPLAATLVTMALITYVLRLVYRDGVARPGPLGVCDECGYSIHGINAARCPECGAGITPKR